MTQLLNLDRVQYRCECQGFRSLSRLYFCRHCLQLRCPNCVHHEVEFIYCANCLEQVGAAEARLRKNRCQNCFECPVCSHTLVTRTTTAQRSSAVSTPASGFDAATPKSELSVSDVAQKKIADSEAQKKLGESESAAKKPGEVEGGPKKVYYLLCTFCRWTTRESSLPDATTASGGAWTVEAECTQAQRIAGIASIYQELAAREKLEREQRKLNSMHKRSAYLKFAMPASAKRGASTALRRESRQMEGELTKSSGKQSLDSTLNSSIKSKADEYCEDDEPDELADLFVDEAGGDECVLSEPDTIAVSTLEQRLRNVDLQPSRIEKLMPTRKTLSVRKSFRCKRCEHNLSKADSTSVSTRFKIQLNAYYHVPEVRLAPFFAPEGAAGAKTPVDVAALGSAQPFEFNVPRRVVLTIANPHQRAVEVRLSKLEDQIDMFSTARLELPPIARTLLVGAQSDVAQQYDDALSGETASMKQQGSAADQKAIAFRKGNKLGLLVTVVPMKSNGDVIITLQISYDYRNALTSSERAATAEKDDALGKPSVAAKQQPSDVRLTQTLLCNFGSVSA